MKFFKRHCCGNRYIPTGYRVAYFDLCRNEAVCCPIGLHLVVMLFRRLWELSFWCKTSRMERLMEAVRRTAVQRYIRDQPQRKYTWGDIENLLSELGDRSNLP